MKKTKEALAKRIYIVLLLGLSLAMQAQVKKHVHQTASQDSIFSQKELAKASVILENAKTLSYNELMLPGAEVVAGNVRFRHEDNVMYCDSAHFYPDNNNFEAFGHIRIVQADTLVITGKHLYYDGNSRIATLTHSCRLATRTAVLETDSMTYDRTTGTAYYYNGAVMTDKVNSMTSDNGQYTTQSKQSSFRGEVVMVNPDFTMVSETLDYNTESHIANLNSPTMIVYDKSTVIGGSEGSYNTESGHAVLTKSPSVVHDHGIKLYGDTIYYDRKRDYGEVHGHLEIIDTVQNTTIWGINGSYDRPKDFSTVDGKMVLNDWDEHTVVKGDKGTYDRTKQLATVRGHMVLVDSTQETTLTGHYGFYDRVNRIAMATDSAQVIDWSDSDKVYIHGDTLYATRYDFHDTLTMKDTTYQTIRAFHNVRLYKSDLQAICDSMYMNNQDSIMHLRLKPILWNEKNQLSADSADVYVVDGMVEHAHMMGNCLAVQEIDSTHYNQLLGNDMVAYVRDSVLTRVDVSGNVETCYYPQEEGKDDLLGCNKTQSSYLRMYFKDGKVNRAVFTTATTGAMYPVNELPIEEQRLRNFFWGVKERPSSPESIFDVPVRTQEKSKKASAAGKKGRGGKE